MIDFAPGMRTIIRDEEWMVKKIETNSLGNKTLYCVGISPLVKDREAIFLTDLEEIQIVDPAEVKSCKCSPEEKTLMTVLCMSKFWMHSRI